MIVGQALFEGRIHDGREAAFRAYVADRLLPLWRRFPEVREVRVLHGIEHDPGVPQVAPSTTPARSPGRSSRPSATRPAA